MSVFIKGLGKVFMFAGHPGLGKSQAMISMAAIVTTGGIWPVDRVPCERGSVIEDDAEDTIRPRLEAAGADLDRVYILEAIREPNKDGTFTTRPFNLTADIDRLSELAEKLGDVALIVIDPITAYLGGIDSHKNARHDQRDRRSGGGESLATSSSRTQARHPGGAPPNTSGPGQPR